MLQQQMRDKCNSEKSITVSLFSFCVMRDSFTLFCMHITSVACKTEKACILGLKKTKKTPTFLQVLMTIEFSRIDTCLNSDTTFWNTTCWGLRTFAWITALNYLDDLGRRNSNNHFSLPQQAPHFNTRSKPYSLFLQSFKNQTNLQHSLEEMDQTERSCTWIMSHTFLQVDLK